eukprot:g3376.t1
MADPSSRKEDVTELDERAAHHVRALLEILGEDAERDGLLKTPMRVAKSLRFLTGGMRGSLGNVVNGAVFDVQSEEMVLVRDIDIFSLCEHHMLPFMGKVHIAYVPNGKVIGLSKLARISELYSRRLQVQERLTTQIAEALMEAMACPNVAVVMECAHMCMAMRGVQKPGATTITSCMRGSFSSDPHMRAELMTIIGLPPMGSRRGDNLQYQRHAHL